MMSDVVLLLRVYLPAQCVTLAQPLPVTGTCQGNKMFSLHSPLTVGLEISCLSLGGGRGWRQLGLAWRWPGVVLVFLQSDHTRSSH